MSKPVRLYDYPFSGNGYKIRLALSQLSYPFEHIILDLLTGDTRTPAFLAKNPMGQIPVLELEDGTFLRESNSILFWLAEDTHLMPSDKLAKARVVQWMCFEQSNIDKVLGRTRFLRRFPDFMPTTKSDWDGWYSNGYQALEVLEAELADQEFLVSNTYSAADICLYGYVNCAEDGGFVLDRFPRIRAWRDRVSAQTGHIEMNPGGVYY